MEQGSIYQQESVGQPRKRPKLSDNPQHIPTVSFRAFQRARTTVEDFVLSYFPYHNLHVPEDFFKYLDIILFVETTIYEMDEENEALAAAGKIDSDLKLAGQEVLMAVLKEQGLLSDRLTAELEKGLEYWRMERMICAAWLAAGNAHSDGAEGVPGLTLDDVHKASLAKSFDYRVLNLLLFHLTKQPYNEKMLEFLAVDEHLVDISDDLVDYEDDVCANSFNIYRAYVHHFGADSQLQLVRRISTFEERHKMLLQQMSPEFQKKHNRRQGEAATDPGSEKWIFPAPIYNESAFRDQMNKLDSEPG